MRVKEAYAWDSAHPVKRKHMRITVRAKRQGQLVHRVKVIPRWFLRNAIYPVYTDTTSTVAVSFGMRCISFVTVSRVAYFRAYQITQDGIAFLRGEKKVPEWV